MTGVQNHWGLMGDLLQAAVDAVAKALDIDRLDARRAVEAAAPHLATALLSDGLYLMHHRFPNGEEFGLFRDKQDAERRLAERRGPDTTLAEVIGLAVIDLEGSDRG